MNASTTARLLFVLFIAAIAIWRIWETFHKQGSERGHISMRWSFYLLFAMSGVVFAGTVLEFFCVHRSYRPAVAVLGAVMFVVANLIRMSAIRMLGRFWSLHVEIRDEHQFVQEGVYSVVRHPAYLAFVLEHVAVPLVGNAWWSLLVTLLVYVPVLLWRVRGEEEVLVVKFGETYRTYQREVGALVPRFCARHRSDENSGRQK